MAVIQLPIVKGAGKCADIADYVDLLPENMLAVQKDVLSAAGYMHSVPGIVKTIDVDGVSRGAEYNTKQNAVFRVAGGVLYSGTESQNVAIPGSGRVSMAHSYNSQGIAAGGKLYYYQYSEKTLAVLENWPKTVIEQAGYEKTLSTWTHVDGRDDAFYVPAESLDGKITITLTPTKSDGTNGEALTISEAQWGSEQKQDKPDGGGPYLTEVIVTGEKAAGSVVTLTWKFNGGGTDATAASVDLKVDEVALDYAQYELGSVRDICHNRSRYIWVKDGADNFGITDLEDETHPDQYRPFYRAESMPDGIQGIASWRDMVVCFGTATTEYFSLTGSTSGTDSVYIAQPSLMNDIGIAGTFCKCHYGESFAVLSHPATGTPGIYLIDSGSKTELSTPTIRKILAGYSAAELSAGVLEHVQFDGHDLLIVHLPQHVLCFDSAVSARSGAQWCILKSGLYSDVWRAIDLVWNGSVITLGDKREGVFGALDFTLASQYGGASELLLYTPLAKADNSLLFDLQLESAAGLSAHAEQCFVAATTDGVTYGREQLIPSNSTFRYDQRVLLRRIGRCRKNIGFRFRFVTSSPASLAQCQLRSNDG
ncbi:packaged DNA stabilization protein [Pantoea agglomerans]|uniref:packaged DNA stabilization protein n=1 Tax=Enterobacter agglomerans TaxID=549 RepID=UPI003FD6188D